MRDGGRDDPTWLSRFGAEVLRWNQQINLISRRGAAPALDHLVSQSVAGFDALWGDDRLDLSGAPPDVYIDLGSGGGIPGFVWHALLSLRTDCRSIAVEPREKRAWFLRRLPSVTGAPAWQVAAGRWGEVGATVSARNPDRVLISLKALHLQDAAVLSGLERVDFSGSPLAPDAEVIVTRFVPGGTQWKDDHAVRIGALPDGRTLSQGARRFLSGGGRIVTSPGLAERAASLSVSCYTCQA